MPVLNNAPSSDHRRMHYYYYYHNFAALGYTMQLDISLALTTVHIFVRVRIVNHKSWWRFILIETNDVSESEHCCIGLLCMLYWIVLVIISILLPHLAKLDMWYSHNLCGITGDGSNRVFIVKCWFMNRFVWYNILLILRGYNWMHLDFLS